jgi:uncharacterized protein (TIGR03437 family)
MRSPSFVVLLAFFVCSVTQAQTKNPPISINIAAVGDNDTYVASFPCAISATVQIADSTIVSVTPTSSNFPSGTARFNIVGLRNGQTVVTITYVVSSNAPCMPNSPNIIDTLDVTVGSSASGGASITGLANNYSYIPAGVPNYGIAQGSIFDIFGTALAPSATGLQSVPLSTSLASVTVTVTVNGTTTNVIIYYVTPTQIAGILPSNTPVGSGMLSVLNNGTVVASTTIQVVQSGFGILTLNGLGTGQAAAFDVNNNYLSFINALHPEEYVILWGTGVGPVAAGTNETVKQTPTNLSNVPFKAWIGGMPATVYYHGRSTYPGLDQVILIVPKGVTPGCYVSVVTQSGNIVSNTATIPVASSGRTCSEPTEGVSASQYQTLESLGTISFGFIAIADVNSTFSGMTVNGDYGGGLFFKLTPAQFNSLLVPFPSLGSCMLFSNHGGTPVQVFREIYPTLPPSSALDPGSIVVTGPAGSAEIPNTGPGVFNGLSNPLGASFIPATGGNITVDNGSGGSEVGKFSGSVTLGAGGVLSWTNESSINTVNRANGVTVNWSGAGTDTFVVVSGSSSSQQAPFSEVEFFCSVPSSAGSFTVPPFILAALPAAGSGQIPATGLAVSQISLGQGLGSPQVNAGIIISAFTFAKAVTFQ